MRRVTVGTVLFVLGAAAIFVAGWLVMWWIWPIWHHTPAAEFEGTIWAFGGPVFAAIALAMPGGMLLLAIGALLRAGAGGPSGYRLAALIGLAALIFLVMVTVPTLAYFPTMFGIGGGIIVVLFFATVWNWSARRAHLQGDAAQAADLFFAALLCFFATAPLLCSLLGNPYSGLYFPERVIRDDALRWYYAMGTKILWLQVAGWGFLFWSQRVARRGRA